MLLVVANPTTQESYTWRGRYITMNPTHQHLKKILQIYCLYLSLFKKKVYILFDIVVHQPCSHMDQRILSQSQSFASTCLCIMATTNKYLDTPATFLCLIRVLNLGKFTFLELVFCGCWDVQSNEVNQNFPCIASLFLPVHKTIQLALDVHRLAMILHKPRHHSA